VVNIQQVIHSSLHTHIQPHTDTPMNINKTQDLI